MFEIILCFSSILLFVALSDAILNGVSASDIPISIREKLNIIVFS
jgi:hypothetical protein